MSVTRRHEMIDAHQKALSLSRQCQLPQRRRSDVYYRSKGESALNLKLMTLIDQQHLDTPGMDQDRWPAVCVVRGTVSAASGRAG